MELASIRNQLVLLFNNLKNIQPSERDSLITYMKTTLSQIQESGGEDKCHNNSNDNYDYSSSSSSNSSSSKSDVINTSSITNSSSTNQMVKKSPNLSNLTSPNLNYLQLTETTSETVAVDEVTDFTTLATTVNHDTSIDGHDFSEVIDVDEFLSITDPPAFNCCDSSNELNLGETFQENSILVDNNSSNNFKQLTTVSQYQLCNDETFLNCPLCRVNFENWPILEKHLYNDHISNSVAPVCWRCQGIFKNHAVLLAHECFDWGRLHLPCRVFINNSLKSFNTFSKIELQRKQYPIDGVFLSRRCGLCYKSSVIFTSYEEFEKHKSSSHSVHGIDSGFEPPQPSKHLRPSVCSITRKKKRSLKRNTPSSIHPCSDAAVRSVVRNLTERFYMLKNQRVGEKRRQRRRKSTVGNTSDDFIENYTSDGDMISDIHQSEAMLEVPITTRCIDNITTTNPTTASGITDASVSPTTMTSSISSHEQSSKSTDYCPSTFLTSLLAAQRAKRNLTLKNKRSRQHRDVSFDSDVTDQLIAGEEVDLNASKTKTTSFPCDIPPSPSIGSYISERENESVHSRTNSWLLRQRKRILPSTRSSSRHLKLQFRRKSAIGFRKMKNTMSSTCDYRVNPIKIRRFICHCCSAVFRLSSRLRAHYLFQHGHIPESLGGLSPRPNEAVLNCEWSQSVNNDDNDLNTDNNFDINNVSDIDNQSESICTTVYNELCTQYTGKINSTLETVGTQLVSSDAHNKLESISLGMNTRMRKRKAVSSNNATSVTSTTTASTASLTRNSRRAKKQASEMISAMTNHISSVRDHNSRSKSSSKRRTTDSLSEHLTTEEIDQLLPDSNLLLKRYYCRECNATFKSAYNVKRHEGIVHRREYRYFCGYCEFRTGERLAYEEHLARHFSVKQFVCETCNARFTIKHELDDHIAFKHSNERNFACSECDQRFKTSGTLWRHKKIHEKRVYHICSICSTSFTRLSNLNRHLLRTHKRQKGVQQSQSTGNESLVGNSNRPTNRRTTTKLTVNNDGSESSRNCQPSKKNFMPSSNDNTCGVDEDSNLKTPLNSFDVQCQQTIGDVIPLEIITPQISGGNCSSNRQTVINILSDHHPGFSQLISIADGNLDEGVSVNQSMSSSCSAPSSSSSSLDVMTSSSTSLSTRRMGDVTLTTEDSVIPTNITTYHTVNITDNTTLYMLNFADINAAGHSFFESTCTNLMPENSDNPHQTMMVSVPDPIYHQTSVFSEGIVVSSSSVETLSSSTLPSSSSSLSSTVSASSSVAATAAGATISLHPNILLPIQLTTNSFSPKSSTVSTIGHNSSTGEEVIVSSNPWSTVMSCHPEPSLCYLITATEPIETEVSCDTGNSDCNHTNVHTITNNNSDIHIDDELGDNPGDPAGVNVEDNIRCGGDASNSLNVVKEQSISSVDILNSFQSEVNHMITDGVLKADCNSPQIQLNENCIFYESCSSSLSTAISSACSSLSMSSTFCPSTSIWRPIDDPVGFDSIAKHHQHHPFQIPMASHCSTTNAAYMSFPGDNYHMKDPSHQSHHHHHHHHRVHQLFPIISESSHDDFPDCDGNNNVHNVESSDVTENIITSTNTNVSNTPVSQMTTNLLDTNMIISWNPPNNNDNTNTNNPSTDFYHYQHCSPKFPSPDPGNLSPSPILSDHHQHQFELPNFSLSQSNHQNMLNPVGSFVGASLTSSSSSSSSSVSCDSNSNDSTNFLRQFYHDTSPISNVTLTHGDNFSLLPSIPNIVMSERNVCYPTGQLNDEFHDISDSADQCSNFSVGYLIGHSSIPSSSSSSSSTSLLSASRCVVMQTEQNAIIMPSVCSSTTTGTVNYLNNSLPHPSDQQHHPRSLSSQLSFSNDPIDYEFV